MSPKGKAKGSVWLWAESALLESFRALCAGFVYPVCRGRLALLGTAWVPPSLPCLCPRSNLHPSLTQLPCECIHDIHTYRQIFLCWSSHQGQNLCQSATRVQHMLVTRHYRCPCVTNWGLQPPGWKSQREMPEIRSHP